MKPKDICIVYRVHSETNKEPIFKGPYSACKRLVDRLRESQRWFSFEHEIKRMEE